MAPGRGFKRKTALFQPSHERVTKWPARPSVKVRAAIQTIADACTAQPKTQQHRNPRLLAMARNQSCLLLVPGCCNHRTDTTVAAHSNLGTHGKAKSRKADDFYSIASCSACHSWLDQGSASKAQKEIAFMAGHLRQVLAWRQIAGDAGAPAADRRAVTWKRARLWSAHKSCA